MPELDAAAFEALLAHFDIDRTRAGEKYELLRLKLVKFFEWNRCRQADDLADEVLNRLAVKMCTVAIEDLGRFALGIARYVQLEATRKESRHVELTDESAGAATRVEDDYIERFERRRLQGCLQRCLSELSETDRQLLGEFFKPIRGLPEHRLKLAEANGISIGALRTRVCRIRTRLESCVSKCSG